MGMGIEDLVFEKKVGGNLITVGAIWTHKSSNPHPRVLIGLMKDMNNHIECWLGESNTAELLSFLQQSLQRYKSMKALKKETDKPSRCRLCGTEVPIKDLSKDGRCNDCFKKDLDVML